MFLKEFNQSPARRIAKVNKFLKEEFDLSIATFPSLSKLEKINETADMALIKLKNSGKQFHLQPDYAKFLGIKDVVNNMINEGMYAESPKYKEMKEMICASVEQLMDSGYTMDEACNECMNRYRMDSRFAYDDEHVLPIIIKAAKDYMESCNMESAYEGVNSDLNERLLAELARECGVEVSIEGLNAIEEKLAGFAEVTGKSRDSVVGFLNSLNEDQLTDGIQMFGRKVAEANKFVKARKDAINAGKDEFEVDGKKYKVTGDTSQELEESEETMFDDIIGEMINEEVDVEQAEVVMAVRAIADDIQGHVEEIGRMMNETIPAIADQIRSEMGAQAAATFSDTVSGILDSYIESAKNSKASVDTAVAQLTGEELPGGLGDTALDVNDDPELDLSDEELDVNEPAAAGPEDEPLGRAPVEI